MKAFARITAIVFITLGILVILGGIFFAASGFLEEQEPASSMSGIIPDLQGMIILLRLFGGGIFSLQGFFLAAIGQGIWLLTDIANNTQQTSSYLSTLMHRNK
ncbi:MAG: hypothetical protein ISR58_13230 [Anaerolineales bacterium]|nr:hypothetical protein [Chloroflexota bacterium]MBL6982139.1 hypothetical protein [Anaerolineales bacterium]